MDKKLISERDICTRFITPAILQVACRQRAAAQPHRANHCKKLPRRIEKMQNQLNSELVGAWAHYFTTEVVQ
jgi:hypothetical protein